MDFVEELKWRGLIQDMVSDTDTYLKSNKTTGYIGFDPTGDSLHLGSFQQIVLLKRLQIAGHRPIALMGGATGRVGDPTGKSEERKLLSEEEINHNISGIKSQLSKFIEFGDGKSDALLVNNYDWFKEINLIDFIRDVGKHISINYMMSKDSVQNRLDTGLSFTEFTYQLIQGYDFYHLNKNYGCNLQLGGSDQWGNILTGVELIRRIDSDKSYAITSPLVLRADGSKFGKTAEGESVYLDPLKTSPYKLYQYILNRTDDEAINLYKRFSFKNKDSILTIIDNHLKEPHTRLVQKALADELTIMIHSSDELVNAQKASAILFSRQENLNLNNFDLKTLREVFDGVPIYKVSKSVIESGVDIVDFFVSNANIYKSNNEIRRLISDNAISINRSKVDLEYKLSPKDIIHNSFIWIQQGKKKHFIVNVI